LLSDGYFVSHVQANARKIPTMRIAIVALLFRPIKKSSKAGENRKWEEPFFL